MTRISHPTVSDGVPKAALSSDEAVRRFTIHGKFLVQAARHHNGGIIQQVDAADLADALHPLLRLATRAVEAENALAALQQRVLDAAENDDPGAEVECVADEIREAQVKASAKHS